MLTLFIDAPMSRAAGYMCTRPPKVGPATGQAFCPPACILKGRLRPPSTWAVGMGPRWILLAATVCTQWGLGLHPCTALRCSQRRAVDILDSHCGGPFAGSTFRPFADFSRSMAGQDGGAIVRTLPIFADFCALLAIVRPVPIFSTAAFCWLNIVGPLPIFPNFCRGRPRWRRHCSAFADFFEDFFSTTFLQTQQCSAFAALSMFSIFFPFPLLHHRPPPPLSGYRRPYCLGRKKKIYNNIQQQQQRRVLLLLLLLIYSCKLL